MCGILGAVGFRVPRERADHARDLMTHRGPDGFGSLHEVELYLGHRRLSILDLSEAGRQPMTSADGRFTISYNGELYNYPQLREELAAEGHTFRSQCDTEVVLELLARHGPDQLRRFNGIFALALWDHRERTLLLARDHFGIKPLYLVEQGVGLAFASETKALHALLPDLDRRVDPRRAVQLLAFGWIPEPHTMNPAVRKLPAGHYLQWRAGHSRLTQYWSLLDEPWATHTGSLEELAEQTRSLLDQAIGRQLLSDVPVGAFLSGGLDSSCIVSRMAQRQADVQTYTITPRDEGREVFSDDWRYAQRVARHLGVALHRIEVAPDLAEEMPFALQHLDDPVADPAAINTWHICKLARDHGSVVVLSGQGGDELFGGYTRLLALLGTQRVPGRRLLRRLGPRLAALGPAALGPLTRPVRRARKVLESVGDPPGRRYARQSAFCADPATILPLLSEDWRRQLGDFDPLEAHREAFNRAATRCDLLASALYTDLVTFMPGLNLLYSDKMSAAASVELRVPFLDLDLVRFAWSVPSRFKIRRTTTKYLLKRAAEDWLPRDVIYRPKRGFGAPVRDWMGGPLKGLLEQALADGVIEGGFDPSAVRTLIEHQARGLGDYGYLLYGLLTLRQWDAQQGGPAQPTP